MLKTDEKIKAIKLRKSGKTYSEILKEIRVSRSSLSLWLRDVGLAKVQKQLITEKRIAGRLRALESIRKNKINRVNNIKDLARKEVPYLIKQSLWLAGTVLYWGEGSKEHARACPVKFTNMDLVMHRLFLNWLRMYLLVKPQDLWFELFIHEKADILKAKEYWMKNLDFYDDQLKVYTKKHNPKTKRKRIGEGYCGVLSVGVYKSIPLNRKIAGWVEGIVVYLSKKGQNF